MEKNAEVIDFLSRTRGKETIVGSATLSDLPDKSLFVTRTDPTSHLYAKVGQDGESTAVFDMIDRELATLKSDTVVYSLGTDDDDPEEVIETKPGPVARLVTFLSSLAWHVPLVSLDTALHDTENAQIIQHGYSRLMEEYALRILFGFSGEDHDENDDDVDWFSVAEELRMKLLAHDPNANEVYGTLIDRYSFEG